MPVTMKGSVPSPTKVLCAPTPSTPYLTGTKSPPPARRTPYHLDDPQYDAERIPQYLALQEEELTLAKSKQEAEKASRVEANALFKARQEALMAAQAADKERVKMLRQDALENMRYEAEGYHTKEDGYGPHRWLWTVASKFPRQWATAHDVLVPPQPPMYNGADVYNDERVKYAMTIQAHEDDLKQKRVATRVADDMAIQSVEERKKLEREEESKKRREAILAKQAAEEKAAALRARTIKKEMAEETRRQQALQEKKEAKKLKESMQQRQANITYAKEHGQYDWGIQRQPDLPKLKGGSPSKTGGGAD